MEVQENITKPPLLSVCIFAYNHEKFITQAIESVLEQKTTFDFEILIGEDGSKDTTPDIVKSYEVKYPEKIKVLFQDQSKKIYINGNPTGKYNFITTLQTCRGKYIALLDGDDYWTDPLKLQQQVDFLEGNPAFVGTFHDCIIVNTQNDTKHLRIGNTPIDEEPDLESTIIKNNHPTASLVFRNIVKNEFFPSWFEESSKGDYALVVLLARHGRFKYFNAPMSVYRVHPGGVWSSQSRLYMVQQDIKFYKSLESISQESRIRRAVRVKQKWANHKYALELVKVGKFFESVPYLMRSLFIFVSDQRLKHGSFFSYLLVLGSTVKSIIFRRKQISVDSHK